MTRFNRRNFIGISSGAIAVGLSTQFVQPGQAQGVEVPYEKLNPALALERLVQGNQRFIEKRRENPNQTLARVQEVALGQKPFAAILGCADSRVPAEIIFDQGLGDLFVCRIAGNIATTEQIGSLEFGNAVLGAKVIMVLGHGSCGAVQASLDQAQVPGEIGSVLRAIQPGIQGIAANSEQALERATIANVRYQMGLLKQSPVIAELIKAQKTMIVGGYYELAMGSVRLINDA